MAKRQRAGKARTGAITLGTKPVNQNRAGVAGAGANSLLGPVRSGRPSNKATGAPIRNGRPVRQATGTASLRSGGPGGTLQGMRTSNRPASAARSGLNGQTPIRSGSRGVNQSISTQGGNFVRTPLRTGRGAPRQHPSMLAPNVDKARGRKQSNSGRLGTIGVETHGGRSGTTRKH